MPVDKDLSGGLLVAAENQGYGCPNCANPIDNCECACPYCGESSGCDCAIGHDKATGG